MINIRLFLFIFLALGCQRASAVTHVMSLNGSNSVEITCEQGFSQCLNELRRECSSGYRILFLDEQGLQNHTLTAMCQRDAKIN